MPLDPGKIAEALEIAPKDKSIFLRELATLEKDGRIVRLKRDRLCLPRDADLVTGRIAFRQSGSAVLHPEATPGQPISEPVDIRSDDTWVARHNDRVVARLNTPERRGGFKHPGGKGKKGRPLQAAASRRTARVIRILERAKESITGTLKKSRHFYYVIPDDPRMVQDILVPDPSRTKLQPRPQPDDKVVVRLLEWNQRHLNPEGEITAVLGHTRDPFAEFQAILHNYELDPEFPPEVMAQVDNVPSKVSEAARQGRLDCRGLFTCTIDPDDAKDFDDALSLERREDGSIRVGIHIADVNAYVGAGSPLDNEARRRGNSTYLVGSVIPMLPHALSNGICSLVEAEDRLTKTVFADFDAKGNLLKTSFANTVIRSSKRLTYKQAYAFLQENDLQKVRATPLPPKHQTGSTGRDLKELSKGEMKQLQQTVRELWRLASRLRRQRMKAGSLDLDMPESKIFVNEEGYADRIELIQNDESHQLVEEFMLLANEAVAKAFKRLGLAAIYRVHDQPEEEKLQELREFMGTVGITVGDLTKRREVSKMMNLIREHPQAYTLRIQFLRSLKQACYRASADGHYGLAKADYTHFTSPIRRYSDLVVHRIFEVLLQKSQGGGARENLSTVYTQGRLESIAEHVSITERNSTEAERESVKVKMLEFFEREVQRKNKTVFAAAITDTRNHGMFIELIEAQAFGLIHISTLRDDHYVLSSEGTKLVGRRSKKVFAVGQHIKVVAERVDRFKRQIDFALAP